MIAKNNFLLVVFH